MSPRLALACLIGLLCGTASALARGDQADRMVFQPLTTQDGLSQSTVNSIFQDSYGLMWFATENGLNRYDGYGFKSYLRDRDNPYALESDFIWAIAEDSAANLWLASEGAGLIRWDRGDDKFHTVALDIPDADPGASRLARSLIVDARGELWMGTRGAGLLHLNADGRLLHRYAPGAEPPDRISGDAVTVLTTDGGGRVWVGSSGGVDRIDPQTGEAQPVPVSDQPLDVSSILLDSQGGIWVGTFEQGLYWRPQPGAPFQALRHADEPSSLSSDQIRALYEDADGRVWVATQDGLNLYDRERGAFRAFHHSDKDPFSLSDDRLMSLVQDRTGILWVGTRVGGVNRWNPRSWTLGEVAPPELAGAVVLAFTDAGNRQTWVGTIGAGLLKVNDRGQVVDRFDAANGYPALADDKVTALLTDRRGALWIGTMMGGLHRFEPGSGRLDLLQNDPDAPNSLGANGIMCLFEDQAGGIWAGTFGGGIARIDGRTLDVTRFQHDPSNPDSLSSPRATAITQAADGRLWIGTDGGGLNLYDPETRRFRAFQYDPDNPRSLGSDTVYSLHAGADGALWVGTAGAGLARLAGDQIGSADPLFESLVTADGLSSNVINGIEAGDDGALWLSSTNGLMRLNPTSRQITAFHAVQGLHGEEFNFGAHYRHPDGRLDFGGTGGFNSFQPGAVKTGNQPPAVILTAFEKFNEPATTDAPYADLREIDLGHRDDVITFEYAALDYTAPEQNLYSTYLDGFDREWSPPSPRRRTTYTNLDPGDYVFRVRAASSDGVWNPDALNIAVRVAPAPWATPWAFGAYALAAVGLLFGFLRWRLRQLEREARINQLAYYDKVTGLPNRELFEIRVEHALENAREHAEPVAVIAMRVGPFRKINDTLGYRATDDLLRTLATRAGQVVLGSNTSSGKRELAWLGDSTFTVSISGGTSRSEATTLARKLIDALSAPLDHGGHHISIPVFAGISGFPAHGDTAGALISFAQTAASDARQSRQSTVVEYQEEMTATARDRLALENDLRKAIAQDQLALHLQAKHSPKGLVIGAEALCRWHHPDRGPVSPGVFVPLAEESELIMELDRWVITQACKTLRQWQDNGLAPVPIAVNVSADTFTSGTIFAILEQAMSGGDLSPALLEIEITESVLAGDLEKITEALTRLKTMGHTLSLDDFGTGYSSLTYLQRFPIDKVKIDQAFVRNMEHRRDQRALCTAIIAMARSLSLRTIAEGIETEEQLEILVELGCDQMQGFLLHRPAPIPDFEPLLSVAHSATHRPATV